MSEANQSIIVEKRGGATIIRFDNLKERNPLSVRVQTELDAILTANTRKANALIFTGTADVFASGANLREIAQLATEQEIREFGWRGQRLMQKIADAPCLTIAAVNGLCFGGAFDLALACKIRVASQDAIFSHPGANLGIMTGWSGTQRLPRLVGEAAALEIFLTAKRIDAAEALRINLISTISANVLETALEICSRENPKMRADSL